MDQLVTVESCLSQSLAALSSNTFSKGSAVFGLCQLCQLYGLFFFFPKTTALFPRILSLPVKFKQASSLLKTIGQTLDEMKTTETGLVWWI